jgi:methyl-accepting chemotaxis protein
MQGILRLKALQDQRMEAMETSSDAILDEAEALEIATKELISDAISRGRSVEQLFATENTWADMAMELKATIALTRIVIEEYAQSATHDRRDALVVSYRAFIKEFDGWIDALLNGAINAEGRIAAVNHPRLRELVHVLDRNHNDSFQQAANALVTAEESAAARAWQAGCGSDHPRGRVTG